MQPHGILAMKNGLKSIFLYNIMKRAWTKFYNAFENFKIALLLTQI